MAMALVQRRTPDAHNFLFPRRHPISGLEIMELRDDPRNSLNRPDIYIYIYNIYIYDCLVFGRHGWTVVISWWLMNKDKLMPILAQGIEPK